MNVLSSNVLSCVQAVSGKNVSVSNASSFYDGMTVKVMRDLNREVGQTTVSNVTSKQVRLWPWVDVKPGDLLMVVGN